MNSLAQSPQRGGSSDQQAAGVPIITASNGRRNEEQQRQIVDVNSSHGTGDHSSDKAKEQDPVAGSIENGVLIVCSFFATFCLEAILNLPGGIEWDQLQSKPMNNITVGQLQQLQSFLITNVSCFLLSVATIFLVTFASCYHYKHRLHLNLFLMGALMSATTLLLKEGLVLATNHHLAHVAFMGGLWVFLKFMAILIILGLLITKIFRSFIRKACSKIRDLITKLLSLVLSLITRQ